MGGRPMINDTLGINIVVCFFRGNFFLLGLEEICLEFQQSKGPIIHTTLPYKNYCKILYFADKITPAGHCNQKSIRKRHELKQPNLTLKHVANID